MKELTLEVTNYCPRYCIHCSTRATDERGIIFVPKSDLIDYIDRFSDFEKVRFSGGEPLAHRDIIELVKSAKEKKRFVEILTSGSAYLSPITKEQAKGFAGSLDNIAFSIYGNREIHSEIVGGDALPILDGSVDRMIEFKIPLSFTFVAMTETLAGLEHVFRYVAKKTSEADYCKPKLAMLRYIKQGRGIGMAIDLSLTPEQIEKLKTESRELAEKYGVDLRMGCSFGEDECRARTGKRAVTYKGEIIDCSSLKDFHKEFVSGSFPCSERW